MPGLGRGLQEKKDREPHPAALPVFPRIFANALDDKVFLLSDHRLLPRRGGSVRRVVGRLGHVRAGDDHRRVVAVAAAGLRRLEGAPGMHFAVGQAGNLVLAAEMEVRVTRMADRPIRSPL